MLALLPTSSCHGCTHRALHRHATAPPSRDSTTCTTAGTAAHCAPFHEGVMAKNAQTPAADAHTERNRGFAREKVY